MRWSARGSTGIESEAEHIGFGWDIVLQDVDRGTQQGIRVLGKAADDDAALALAELLANS